MVGFFVGFGCLVARFFGWFGFFLSWDEPLQSDTGAYVDSSTSLYRSNSLHLTRQVTLDD